MISYIWVDVTTPEDFLARIQQKHTCTEVRFNDYQGLAFGKFASCKCFFMPFPLATKRKQIVYVLF
jgi:hypothetical protein